MIELPFASRECSTYHKIKDFMYHATNLNFVLLMLLNERANIET